MAKKRTTDAAFNRRLRRERERAFWNWTLDLDGVTTEARFVALIKEHIRERIRGGFIRELRITAGARFWSLLNWELASYFGSIHVRVRDWAGFQQRLPDVARKLQGCFRQLRGECGAGFLVEYDSTTTTGVRQRTYIRYFFAGRKCKLTVPALAKSLRKWKAVPPLMVIERTWNGLEFDLGPETRTLPRSSGLDVQQAGCGLHLVLNANARRVRQLLNYLADTGIRHEADLLSRCERVLEAWSEDDDPDTTMPIRWHSLETFIETTFPGILVEPDAPTATQDNDR